MPKKPQKKKEEVRKVEVRTMTVLAWYCYDCSGRNLISGYWMGMKVICRDCSSVFIVRTKPRPLNEEE